MKNFLITSILTGLCFWVCISAGLEFQARMERAAKGNVKVRYYVAPVGSVTRSGELYNPFSFSCAVNDSNLMDKWLRVEFNGKVVYVYANDFRADSAPPIKIDLTPAAFARLAPLARGVIDCKIEEAK